MSDEPRLAIKWAGATEAEKAKALDAINAAFAAVGMTAAEGARAQFDREATDEDPNTVKSSVTSEQHAAADLWMTMEEIAATALGKDPRAERLPDFIGWIEPWITEEQINQMKFL